MKTGRTSNVINFTVSILKLRLLTILFAFSLTLSCADAMELYVSPDGNASNAGTKDSPVTFDAAVQRASKSLKEKDLAGGGISIHLLGGHYTFNQPFVLGSEFKGTETTPIIIQAVSGGEVLFDGGMQIAPDGFAKVTDPDERSRLAASAADHVLAKTIENPELIAKFKSKLVLTLSYDTGIYLPSVYPNEGYAMLKNDTVVPEVCPPGIPVGKEGYSIRAGSPPHQEPGRRQGWKGNLNEPRGAQAGIGDREDEMAGTWAQWEREIKRNNTRNQLTGFIEASWLLSSQPIYSASAEKKCVQLSRVLGYGWAWRKDKQFKVFGLLCELDQPGEWHFDTLTNRLYIYPPKPMTSKTMIGLPVAAGFMTLKNTSYVSIIGLDVQNVGSGNVFYIEGGDHNLIAGATVRNSTAGGFRVGGRYNGVKSCDLVDLDSHMTLGGGVRSANEITPGHNYVENCHFYQKGFKHEKVNISLSGVGNRFSNNLVHNSIGQAMTISGNDHIIELNEMFNIGFEEGDGGAMYSGGDLTGYGTVYRHNFYHHLMHVPGKVARSGIHLDDLQAGSTCIGNVFFKSAQKGIFMNAGAGHTLIGNVCLQGSLGIYNVANGSQRNYDRQEDALNNPQSMYRNTKENYIARAEKIIGKEGWAKSPWRDKYPLFNKVMSDTGQYGRMWPIRCHAENNMYYGNTRKNETFWDRFAPGARAKSVIKNDIQVTPDDFVDYDKLDLRFKKTPAGVKPIPFERIGLYLDEYRDAMPDKNHYRKTTKEFFKGIKSMPGTKKQIDTAKVVEQGPIIKREK